MSGLKAIFICQCAILHLLNYMCLSFATDLESLIMVNKNCPARGIEQNEEPEGV